MGKNITALFDTFKRRRVDAGVNALRISVEPNVECADEKMKMVGVTEKTRNLRTMAKASDGFDLHPLPGFEPNPCRHVNTIKETAEGSQGQEGDETVSSQGKACNLSTEQKMRMEVNKAVARSKRNLRVCEEHIAEFRKLSESYPDFQNLLVEQSWREVLQDEFSKQYMRTLHTFVQQEAAGKLPVYPPPLLVFNAFNTCPFDKVKVVIIGQDPYHGPSQAMGLCFSVPQRVKIPSSLVNIFKEIRDDVGTTLPSHGNLEKWAHQQKVSHRSWVSKLPYVGPQLGSRKLRNFLLCMKKGVLLLNAVLTVREHHANSHSKKGWEPFTDAAIRVVAQKKKGVIFLLWGNSAQDKTRLIDTKEHHILKAAHPSGLSAHKGFFKCRHFSKTNEILKNAGELPIDWQL